MRAGSSVAITGDCQVIPPFLIPKQTWSCGCDSDSSSWPRSKYKDISIEGISIDKAKWGRSLATPAAMVQLRDNRLQGGQQWCGWETTGCKMASSDCEARGMLSLQTSFCQALDTPSGLSSSGLRPSKHFKWRFLHPERNVALRRQDQRPALHQRWLTFVIKRNLWTHTSVPREECGCSTLLHGFTFLLGKGPYHSTWETSTHCKGHNG